MTEGPKHRGEYRPEGRVPVTTFKEALAIGLLRLIGLFFAVALVVELLREAVVWMF